MTNSEFLSHFKGVIDRGDGQYSVLCPAHEDHNPSLSISFKDGKRLLHCHVGCNSGRLGTRHSFILERGE